MKKILVVDDEKPISDIIKFNMAKEGYEVLTAFDVGKPWKFLLLKIQILLFWT